MRRVPNWSQKLVAFAIEQRELAFEWGRSDCGSLVRRGLELVFGEPVLELAGYASELEAERTMKQLGEAATFFESQGAASERGSVPRDRRRGRAGPDQLPLQ